MLCISEYKIKFLKNLIVGTATLAEAAVLQKVNMHSMTETLELLTFFYIILLKKLPRNGTFFLVGGNCFPLLKYYRAGSCAPHAHMSKQQHKNQLKVLIMVLVYDSE